MHNKFKKIHLFSLLLALLTSTEGTRLRCLFQRTTKRIHHLHPLGRGKWQAKCFSSTNNRSNQKIRAKKIAALGIGMIGSAYPLFLFAEGKYLDQKINIYEKNRASIVKVLNQELKKEKECVSSTEKKIKFGGAVMDVIVPFFGAPPLFSVMFSFIDTLGIDNHAKKNKALSKLQEQGEKVARFSKEERKNVPLFIFEERFLEGGFYSIEKMANYFEDKEKFLEKIKAAKAKEKADKKAFEKKYADHKFTIKDHFWGTQRSHFLKDFFKEEAIQDDFCVLKYNHNDYVTQDVGDHFKHADCREDIYYYQTNGFSVWNSPHLDPVYTDYFSSKNYVNTFAPYNDRYFFIGNEDGGISIFDAQEKAIKYTLYRSGEPIRSLYTLDENTLVALSLGNFRSEYTIWKRVI